MFLYSTLRTEYDKQNVIFKPLIASGIMAVTTIISYYLINYITVSNTISTLGSICAAVLTYIISVVNIDVLSNDEIMQLPYGNKICKIVKKMKKV